ncbi:MAG: hypothetical protein BTN85_1926 [Candidatus Methanohalarchaeum thermophilum]|uniref:Uncharacterized protein n=1 Tax=Methanohalarchaeum thermophilum TaxID=1903181 RepID=A0A1Q6DSG2_METT1|nr:MAG: hypothetical protein BTN85_1926 [Candidatus Methanohalarchaeum thermophilum]
MYLSINSKNDIKNPRSILKEDIKNLVNKKLTSILREKKKTIRNELIVAEEIEDALNVFQENLLFSKKHWP